MALQPEEIAKWSQRGDPIHAWYSYDMVRGSLTPGRLGGADVSVYPQGSYANKTNIVGDSDVDIVVALKSAFYPDKKELTAFEEEEYAKYYEQASRTWHDFRNAVTKVLREDFFVQEGSKAVKVRSGVIRLPADVLIVLDHRYYKRFPSFEGQVFVEGVQFYASGVREIVNYPKEHRNACAQKNVWTAGNFRKAVRVAKNARNRLIADDDSSVHQTTAPSYFLESLLWNVPNDFFRGRLESAYPRVVGWLKEQAQLGSMDFPNGMGPLFGQTSDTSWSRPKARQIIDGMYRQTTA
jgi:hypothetical protein